MFGDAALTAALLERLTQHCGIHGFNWEILLRGRDPQIGNGSHGLTMKYGFWYFI